MTENNATVCKKWCGLHQRWDCPECIIADLRAQVAGYRRKLSMKAMECCKGDSVLRDLRAELADEKQLRLQAETKEANAKARVAALEDISKRLHSQDNRCTMEPMFCLQKKVRDVGYVPEYGDDTVWIDMLSGDYGDVPPHTDGAEELGCKYRWETVMVAFTEQGLNDYMKLDGHNVKARAHDGEVRVYVESFRRCEEMIRIRTALMAAAKVEVET